MSFAPHLSQALLLALAFQTWPAVAAIYKYERPDGSIEYTDKRRFGTKPQLVIPDAKPVSPSAETPKQQAPRSQRNAAPMHFPKVDSDTQKKRDDVRRDLLREELASEQRELAAAKSAQVAAKTGADQRQLAEAVGLHEKNIEMLNKELARMR